MTAHTTYDVAVVGGGASGLAAALISARQGARTAIVERDVLAGLPILATGNGRCNLSNAHLDPERYRHPGIASRVMGDAPERELEAFFDSVGIVCKQEADGRLYPFSKRAESVRNALLAACSRAGVTFHLATQLERASWRDEAWELSASEPSRPLHSKRGATFQADLRARRKDASSVTLRAVTLRARHVIIACGGSSKDVAGLFGLPHVPEAPVLCPIACSIDGAPDAMRDLDGLRVEAALHLQSAEGMWDETGEVLFRPYGISGIAAFNLSRRIRQGDSIVLDPFFPIDAHRLQDLFARRERALGPQEGLGAAWYEGFIARPLAQVLCVTRDTVLNLTVDGTADERSAQVRRGGVPFDAVDLATLEVHRDIVPSLHVCGEALDMDADCGGFNLAWAWLSGMRAGAAAARRLS